MKVRGNAQQVVEKYLQLARDAATGGDPIMAENYFQHAEHYQRILHANSNGSDNRQAAHGQNGSDGRNGGNGSEPQPDAPAADGGNADETDIAVDKDAAGDADGSVHGAG